MVGLVIFGDDAQGDVLDGRRDVVVGRDGRDRVHSCGAHGRPILPSDDNRARKVGGGDDEGNRAHGEVGDEGGELSLIHI